ncbi:complement C1q-like protein 3 [Saccostrea cucullata]|uniref:complement C1q-like protein 3 n=1 Tax=Saccostrea cuccullata TaxID=36930 RepID=UPI002ED20803
MLTLTNLGGTLTVFLVICNIFYPVLGGTQSDTRVKLDSIKSLIYSNAKATVTLDSVALKELVQLSTSESSILYRGVSFCVNNTRRLSVGAGQIIKYDGIIKNDGNGYDDRTGVFVCPVAGTYMFVVDCLCHLETWLHIKVNKKTVASAYRVRDNSWDQISRTVVVKLRRGDHVKVEYGGNQSRKENIHEGGYSGFTGVLLY